MHVINCVLVFWGYICRILVSATLTIAKVIIHVIIKREPPDIQDYYLYVLSLLIFIISIVLMINDDPDSHRHDIPIVSKVGEYASRMSGTVENLEDENKEQARVSWLLKND